MSRSRPGKTRDARRILAIALGFSWGSLSSYPLLADDTELFVADAAQFQGDARPNVLLVLDTSGSMDTTLITQGSFDPEVSYPGDCDTDAVYYRNNVGFPPTCDTDQYFDLSALVCARGRRAFNRGTGFYYDFLAHYRFGGLERWDQLDDSLHSNPVECAGDGGQHGDGSDDRVYAQSGDADELWSEDPLDEINWGQTPVERRYTIFEGNYVNWFYSPGVEASTRIQVMMDVAENVVNTTNGINIGLMRFQRLEGGSVIHAVEKIEDSQDSMISVLEQLEASGTTPLSETLYEAGQYYASRLVDFGAAEPIQSVAASRNANNPDVYASPIEFGCQKNHIVLLSDGAPNQDVSANDKIVALPGFSELVGSTCDGSGNGACLDDMAAYLASADLDPNFPGTQSVITHAIGFTIDLPILTTTAARGEGGYYVADDTASLSNALTNIVTSVLSTQTSFTAPAVSINSFNRTRTLNDIYLNVFEASATAHWPGNLKKYRLSASEGVILDADGNAAVDLATGTLKADSRSFWSNTDDGAEAMLGGAANRLPLPADRNLYTYFGDSSLTSPTNRITTTNMSIDDALLGIGNPGDPSRDELIDFIRGVDVTDTNLNDDRTEPRYQMGDPLHASATPVIYGGTLSNPDVNDALVFLATNDGFLHALDPVSGEEQWAFVPPEFLEDQIALFHNEPTSEKHYGIDGNMRVQILADNNGVIEPALGEKAHLYFGMRRGGALYYALDITIPESPQLLWRNDASTLPGLGQSWSTPIPTRINIDGAVQNQEKMVLAIAGGYDPSQDADAGSTDNAGNAFYIVDSISGDLLWHASDEGANRNLPGMQYSFPSDLKVVDLDGDNFADRIYTSDMGGQIWRFDVLNGQPAGTLVNGGVLAQLGGAPAADPAVTDNRRFYYPPDVALVTDDNNSFLHLGIGSGHRAHPNSTVNQDRFYALRDYNAFGTRTQAEYNALPPIVDDDFIDITDDVSSVVPIGNPGWRLELRIGGWQGEKVLAESRTFDNQVIFTTFTPGVAADANNCEPALGSNRLYVLDIFNGAPVNNLDGIGSDQELTLTDRYQEFQGSIASAPVLLFPSPDDSDCVGDQCSPPPLACVDLFCFPPGFGNAPVRTFWSQENAQ